MARASREPAERVKWLQMAQHWLRKIPQSYSLELNAPLPKKGVPNRGASFGAEH